MKRIAILSIVLAAALGSSKTALTAPVAVNLTLTGSNLLLTVDALGAITATVNLNAAGTQQVILDDADPLTTSLTLDGGVLALADQTLLLNLGALGNIRASLLGLQMSGLLSTGSIPLNYTGGTWNYTFDAADPSDGNTTSANINNGLLTYAGSGAIALLLSSGTLDFSVDPVVANLPPGQFASLTQTLLGQTGVSTAYHLLLSAPISVFTVIDSDLGINATLQGLIMATATYYPVPEPSSLVLLGIAVAGLMPMYRRLKK